MGPLAQFIIALTNLVRSGAIRKIPQAIKFAEQQFGKVTPLLKKQIEKVFESVKNANYIHENGFFVGNHPKDITKELNLLHRVLSLI